MPVIKRYPNRKLYDTEAKKYINLDDIAAMLRAGREVTVTDNATGEDLTAVTLSQIVLELEKKQSGILPGPVLAGLIKAGGNRLTALQRNLLSQLGFMGQVDEEIRHRVRELVSRGELAEAEAARWLEKLLTHERHDTPAPLPNQDEIERVLERRNVPSGEDMARLMRDLDGLLARLEDLENPPAAHD